MDANTIYQKTNKGSEEIQTRKYKLAPKFRTLLILMDGRTPIGDLANAAKHMGLPENYVEYLEKEGFIAASAPAQTAVAPAAQAGAGAAPTKGLAQPHDEMTFYRHAKQFMNDTAVDALGVRSFFFTLKLEKCNSRKELAGLLDEYTKAIAKGSGDEVAVILTERARALLS